MPRRRAVDDIILDTIGDAGSTKITYIFPIHPVRDFLKNKHYEYLKKDPEVSLECPICYEAIDCKNCFTLLTCSHFLHQHCWNSITNNKCPMCNSH